MDQSKKTMRHFYCRDVLWETFEQMANDFDCSIDYLINEGMRYYARSKNYQSPSSSSSQVPQQVAREAVAAPAPAPARSQTRPPAPPPLPAAAIVEPAPRRNPPTLPPRPTNSRPTLAPPAPRASAEAAGATPPLFMMFNNQRFAIDKEQFIIGRGSKTSDLPIKDGNISRKHAAVIRRNGMYYIKDLGSTNGIDYKGMRIDNKRIDEGDIFHLCDYELRFTYRG